VSCRGQGIFRLPLSRDGKVQGRSEARDAIDAIPASDGRGERCGVVDATPSERELALEALHDVAETAHADAAQLHAAVSQDALVRANIEAFPGAAIEAIHEPAALPETTDPEMNEDEDA
jgi:hypothetical protein